MIPFITILVLVVVLVINYLLAKQFYLAAADKGYDESKYLWISFFLGLAGYLLVIALPDRKSQQAVTSSQSSAGSNADPAYGNRPLHDGEWRCSCGRINRNYVSTCTCGKNRREL